MEDKTWHMTMLFDFFGELLTQKQREYFDLYYNSDLSLSEIAENEGITRQGVRDIIVRAESSLTEFEQKTGIISKHLEMRDSVVRIQKIAEELFELNRTRYTNTRIAELTQELYTLAENMQN